MHIGLARRGYSPTGGAEGYLRRLGHALLAAGHETTLFASPGWPRDQWPQNASRQTVAGRSPKAFANALAALDPGRHCDLLFSLERVWKCDCYRAGDGVHRAWLKRRSHFEPPWRGTLRALNPKHRQLLALEAAVFGPDGARAVIANSKMVRREISEHFPEFATSRIEVVYNGLPAHHFATLSLGSHERSRATLGLKPDDCALLFVGSGWERKGLDCAVAALELLPDQSHTQLLVAGQGNPKPYQSRAPGRLRFLGPVRDMASLYAAADLFVAPTIYDPFSNACLEGLATGLPVLTTSANGFAEILDPGVTGDVFEPGDSPALAALIAAWLDPDRRRAARSACAGAAAPFTIERNVDETLNVLAQLASISPDAPTNG